MSNIPVVGYEEIHAGLDALTLCQREVVESRYINGESRPSVAMRLGTTVGKIRGIERRGIHKLKLVVARSAGLPERAFLQMA